LRWARLGSGALHKVFPAHSVIACIFFAFVCASCSQESAAPQHQGKAGVVSLAPHLTEWVCALGAGGRLVAIGEFDDYPPETQSLPRVGGYINPNLEKITALAPAMIIVPGKHPKVSEYAALNRVPLLNIHMDNFATIASGLAQLGDALECPDKAQALLDKINHERAALERRFSGKVRPKVLLITYRHSHDLNTLYSVGGTSFLSELLHLAGGENIFAAESSPYFEASKESVETLAPEVILEFHAGENLSATQAEQFRKDWAAMPGLPAVANGRILIVGESHALRPGPRVMEVARMLAALLHAGEASQ